MAKINMQAILLVHPLGYPSGQARGDIARLANIMPPLGLASLCAYLEACRFETDIVDCFANPDSDRFIHDWLNSRRPGFIGLSCTTSSFLDGVRIARMAKALVPGIRAVFGGPHVSALKERLLVDFPEIDFSIVGEGEEALAELIRSNGDGRLEVRGLIHRANGEVRFNGYRERGLDLDRLPFPAYHRLRGFPAAYRLPLFNYPAVPNTSCVSSRGCPYICSYCDRSVYRRSYRFNSAEYLYDHLKYLKNRFGIRHVNFYDDQFTLNRGRIEALARLLMERPIGVTYNCAARAEHLDSDLLRLMAASGCWMISLGIESGDPELLARHRQNPDLDMIAAKVRLIHRAGIRVKGLFMMGLPGETEPSIRKTMAYVSRLHLDDLNLAKFTPFPGSALYANIRHYGSFNEDWPRMDCMHFLFVPKGIALKRMEELFHAFYRRHFMQPRILWAYVCMLWKSPDSWRRFFRNLIRFVLFALNDRRCTGPGRAK
jgi:radical SAM superfamily enzyme YgiQ (UPF0313 family)